MSQSELLESVQLLTEIDIYYKDRKCAVNENSSLRIVASVHYNARDMIL